MVSQLYNNVTDELSSAASASDTVIYVSDGSKFADPGDGNYTPLYLIRASDGAHEIVHITSVSGNELSVTRSEEGTDPLVFNSGDTVQVRPTRQSLLDMDGNVKTSTGEQRISEALDSRVIYVDTIADLQALDTSELVDGQLASVQGSEFRWDGSEFLPTGKVNAKAFGVIADGIADDSDAFEEALLSGYPLHASSSDTIRITRTISTPVMRFDGRRCTIDGTEIPGTSTFGIEVVGADPQVAAVTQSVSAGGHEIVVDAIPSAAAEGMWAAIYDTADGSWNTARPYYTKGEFFYIESIDEGSNTIIANSAFFDGYTASSTLKMCVFDNPGVFDAKNFTCYFDESENGPTMGLRIEKVLHPRGEGIEVTGGLSPLSVKRSFNGTFRSTRTFSKAPEGVAGSAYGFVIGVSQGIHVYDAVSSTNNNHAYDCGGGSSTAGIVNRNNVFHNCVALSSIRWDFSLHGNSEYCGYEGGYCSGVILGGNHNFARNTTITVPADTVRQSGVRFTEMRGTSFEVSGNTIHLHDDGVSKSYVAPFDISQSGMINADTKLGGTVDIRENRAVIYSDRQVNDRASGITCYLINTGPDSTVQGISFSLKNNSFSISGDGIAIPIYSRASGTTIESIDESGCKYPDRTYRSTVSGVNEFNKGEGVISHGWVVPDLTYLWKNNEPLAANSTLSLYSRTGETEVLGGTIYAHCIGIRVFVDGRRVISTVASGPVGLQRGKDGVGNEYCVQALPHIHAYQSLEIEVIEEFGVDQSVGATVYLKEY